MITTNILLCSHPPRAFIPYRRSCAARTTLRSPSPFRLSYFLSVSHLPRVFSHHDACARARDWVFPRCLADSRGCGSGRACFLRRARARMAGPRPSGYAVCTRRSHRCYRAIIVSAFQAGSHLSSVTFGRMLLPRTAQHIFLHAPLSSYLISTFVLLVSLATFNVYPPSFPR